MNGRPVLGKAGMTAREYLTGEDAVFDPGLMSAKAGFTSAGKGMEGLSYVEESKWTRSKNSVLLLSQV
jgi:hypothetical protein